MSSEENGLSGVLSVHWQPQVMDFPTVAMGRCPLYPLQPTLTHAALPQQQSFVTQQESSQSLSHGFIDSMEAEQEPDGKIPLSIEQKKNVSRSWNSEFQTFSELKNLEKRKAFGAMLISEFESEVEHISEKLILQKMEDLSSKVRRPKSTQKALAAKGTSTASPPNESTPSSSHGDAIPRTEGQNKYLHRGIWYTIVGDDPEVVEYYGSVENAHKIAVAEVRVLRDLWETLPGKGLSIPLAACVQCFGHVVFAVAEFPVSIETQVSGPCATSGMFLIPSAYHPTVLLDSLCANYRCGRNDGYFLTEDHKKQLEEAPVFGPVELQMHQSPADHRIYILNVARFLPPIDPKRFVALHELMTPRKGPTAVEADSFSSPSANASFTGASQSSTQRLQNEETDRKLLNILRQRTNRYHSLRENSRHYLLMLPQALRVMPSSLQIPPMHVGSSLSAPEDQNSVSDATDWIIEVLIPSFLEKAAEEGCSDGADLKRVLHDVGINMCFLGVLFRKMDVSRAAPQEPIIPDASIFSPTRPEEENAPAKRGRGQIVVKKASHVPHPPTTQTTPKNAASHSVISGFSSKVSLKTPIHQQSRNHEETVRRSKALSFSRKRLASVKVLELSLKPIVLIEMVARSFRCCWRENVRNLFIKNMNHPSPVANIGNQKDDVASVVAKSGRKRTSIVLLDAQQSLAIKSVQPNRRALKNEVQGMSSAQRLHQVLKGLEIAVEEKIEVSGQRLNVSESARNLSEIKLRSGETERLHCTDESPAFYEDGPVSTPIEEVQRVTAEMFSMLVGPNTSQSATFWEEVIAVELWTRYGPVTAKRSLLKSMVDLPLLLTRAAELCGVELTIPENGGEKTFTFSPKDVIAVKASTKSVSKRQKEKEVVLSPRKAPVNTDGVIADEDSHEKKLLAELRKIETRGNAHLDPSLAQAKEMMRILADLDKLYALRGKRYASSLALTRLQLKHISDYILYVELGEMWARFGADGVVYVPCGNCGVLYNASHGQKYHRCDVALSKKSSIDKEPHPIGLAGGRFPNSNVTCSSEKAGTRCEFARLHLYSVGWSPHGNSEEYLQIELLAPRVVVAVEIQGVGDSYYNNYILQYSLNGTEWRTYKRSYIHIDSAAGGQILVEPYPHDKLRPPHEPPNSLNKYFKDVERYPTELAAAPVEDYADFVRYGTMRGNTDGRHSVRNELVYPFEAKFVRFVVNNGVNSRNGALRVEIYCRDSLTEHPASNTATPTERILPKYVNWRAPPRKSHHKSASFTAASQFLPTRLELGRSELDILGKISVIEKDIMSPDAVSLSCSSDTYKDVVSKWIQLLMKWGPERHGDVGVAILRLARYQSREVKHLMKYDEKEAAVDNVNKLARTLLPTVKQLGKCNPLILPLLREIYDAAKATDSCHLLFEPWLTVIDAVDPSNKCLAFAISAAASCASNEKERVRACVKAARHYRETTFNALSVGVEVSQKTPQSRRNPDETWSEAHKKNQKEMKQVRDSQALLLTIKNAVQMTDMGASTCPEIPEGSKIREWLNVV